MTGARRGSRPALAAARIAAAFALLLWAVHAALGDLEGGVGPALRAAWVGGGTSVLGWGTLACSVFGVSFAFGAWRFYLLLTGAGLALRYRMLLRATVVASFFNVVVPGGIAGDAYRVWDVRSDAGRGSETLGLVALERILSLAALGMIGLLAVPFVPLSAEREPLRAVLLGLSLVTALSAVLVLLPALNRWARARLPIVRSGEVRSEAARPGATEPRERHGGAWYALHAIAERIDRALAAVAKLHEQPRRVALAFAISVVCQGLPVLAVYALSQPLDTEVGLPWYGVIVPFVTLLTLAPVTIGGIGVREVLYVELFGSVGMRPEVALSLSLFVFASSLVWAAVGFAIFVLGRRQHE